MLGVCGSGGGEVGEGGGEVQIGVWGKGEYDIDG